MTDKESPGWIVQVTIPSVPEAVAPGSPWRSPLMRVNGPPTFRYFNVAVSSPDKAMEATAKFLANGEPNIGGLSVARKLSAREIDTLKLSAGEVKPA